MYKHKGFFYYTPEEMDYLEKSEEAQNKIPQYKWDRMRPVRWYSKSYLVRDSRGKVKTTSFTFRN